MQTHHPVIFRLSNGLRVVHQFLPREVAHCGLMMGTGSRDERTGEHGLAHFLEHCLFKGTEKRKTFHILSRLDAVGGELNAFTSKEETWIHASHLKEDYERAIELIADIAFHSTFPEKEIEKEKDVIYDELNSYKDSPADLIFEDFDEMLFGNHPFGRTIIGTENSLKRFTREHLQRFHKRALNLNNLIFSSAGNITAEKLQTLLEKHMGSIKMSSKKLHREKVKQHHFEHKVEKKDIHQVHYLLGMPAYDFDHKMRPALSLLNNIIGGPAMNNRLSMRIREKHGIAYHVDSNYSPFSDTGIFTVYLGTDKENLKKSKELLWQVLNEFKKERMSARALSDAKKQIIGQIALAQDSGSAIMFNIAKSLMLFNRIDTLEELFEKIHEISAADCHHVAGEIFDAKRSCSVTYTY
jgi:predicted Zn-dependent peptidase